MGLALLDEGSHTSVVHTTKSVLGSLPGKRLFALTRLNSTEWMTTAALRARAFIRFREAAPIAPVRFTPSMRPTYCRRSSSVTEFSRYTLWFLLLDVFFYIQVYDVRVAGFSSYTYICGLITINNSFVCKTSCETLWVSYAVRSEGVTWAKSARRRSRRSTKVTAWFSGFTILSL